MKTMNCRQLWGACDLKFSANSFDEIAEMSKNHGVDMFQKKDKAHLDAMDKMKELMRNPAEMRDWFEWKKKEFETLPEEE